MRFEGPIYRPPSEADSLLVQATAGCPHNKCTFCTAYKKGPKFRVRPVQDVIRDLEEAREIYGDRVPSVFLPAGNTIAMPTHDLASICEKARELFPGASRITVYGSSQYILEKGPEGLRQLKRSGLSRIHVGMESGDDEVLARIKKGCTGREQIEAGRMVRRAGIELSSYVILGVGGRDLSRRHAQATASALNEIEPDFVRLRTLVPKVNTLLLHQIRKGSFEMLGPHGVLREARTLLEGLTARTELRSDHYTNYVDLRGQMPRDRQKLLDRVDEALSRDEGCFRPMFVGTE
jgi:radical SAM superfamily enzyme YgiQ (UPF0313 family)